MRYKENWPSVQARYREYWARENHDRPLLAITAPKDGPQAGKPAAISHATLKERWFDTDDLLEQVNSRFQNTYLGAEALPVYSPNLGPDVFAAFYGVELAYGEDTSWSRYREIDFDVYADLVLDTDNAYYRKIAEMTRAAAQDGRDKYLVGVTDIHPGADALVSLRGPEQLCLDTIERPEAVKRAVMGLFEGFKTVFDNLARITTRYQAGTTNWMGVWHPARWYVTSCDFAALISNAMFNELVLEELLAELDFLDASIFHLDGPDALRHLDTLLSIDNLKGIQWVYGAGKPTAAHWIGVLQRIQKAGKMIHVHIVPEDLDCLLENLAPEGVLYALQAASQEEADALIRKASAYRKKLF
ncbi:MAG: trimethylamine corrinoid protein 2 [Clostridiaceae bacterium]|jgi:hypothetical protein|nr:trimethylamine corrinoid protein 2 [Clostridiaceae bacterium]